MNRLYESEGFGTIIYLHIDTVDHSPWDSELPPNGWSRLPACILRFLRFGMSFPCCSFYNRDHVTSGRATASHFALLSAKEVFREHPGRTQNPLFR